MTPSVNKGLCIPLVVKFVLFYLFLIDSPSCVYTKTDD